LFSAAPRTLITANYGVVYVLKHFIPFLPQAKSKNGGDAHIFPIKGIGSNQGVF
jgi:hypothetical protein